MSEITSVQTIRAKLNEFEERVTGAIDAANTLARIRTDAEKTSLTSKKLKGSRKELKPTSKNRLKRQRAFSFNFSRYNATGKH